jgi:hypothetical protein
MYDNCRLDDTTHGSYESVAQTIRTIELDTSARDRS